MIIKITLFGFTHVNHATNVNEIQCGRVFMAFREELENIRKS